MSELQPFDVPAFLKQLRARGCSLGEPFSYSSETPSTNDLAKAAARASAPHGATFLADAQTSGRGRRGRQWLARTREALLFSFILRPQLSAEHLSLVTLCVGLGVHAAASAVCPARLGVKWPNDIVSAGKKLAGILVEAESSPGKPFAVVVGVGINVHASTFAEEIAERTTSLKILGSECSREALLASVLAECEAWLARLAAGNTSAIVAALREHDALLGRQISVDGVLGIARGINAEGCLLLESEGRVTAVRSGSVEWPGGNS